MLWLFAALELDVVVVRHYMERVAYDLDIQAAEHLHSNTQPVVEDVGIREGEVRVTYLVYVRQEGQDADAMKELNPIINKVNSCYTYCSRVRRITCRRL